MVQKCSLAHSINATYGMAQNYQFDECPKLIWDYMSEMNKCDTGILIIA